MQYKKELTLGIFQFGLALGATNTTGKNQCPLDTSRAQLCIFGLATIINFEFECRESLKLKTLFIQKRIKRVFLALTAFFTSTTRVEGEDNRYIELVDDVFQNLRKYAVAEVNLRILLKRPVCRDDFHCLS